VRGTSRHSSRSIFRSSRNVSFAVSAAATRSGPAETVAQVGLEERRVLLDWWVLDVLIVVEPIPAMKRANPKWAIVTLRSAPYAPRHFALGDYGSSPSSISSRTQGSSSTSSRPRSACVEPSDAILPSAQAACPRINGSESQSDCASTGTASGDPQLPNATATFLSNPRRLVRFTGDPLNLRENSSCDSAINSTSGVPCTPSLGQNAFSDVTVENLSECGHTSREVCRLSRFLIPLKTGRLTVRPDER
jgi:hypothetical protein